MNNLINPIKKLDNQKKFANCFLKPYREKVHKITT